MPNRLDAVPGCLLHVTVSHVLYPMIEIVLHQVFDPYGIVVDMEILESGDDVVVLVQYGSTSEAARALGALHGRRIYDSCCQLSIEYASALDPAMLGACHMFDKMPNNHDNTTVGVLSVTVRHVLYPVTQEVLLKVFHAYGAEKLVLLERTPCIKALVQFRSERDAEHARLAIHGRCIYDNCCVLDVQHVLLTRSDSVMEISTTCPTTAPNHDTDSWMAATKLVAKAMNEELKTMMQEQCTEILAKLDCMVEDVSDHCSEILAKLDCMVEDVSDIAHAAAAIVVEPVSLALAVPVPSPIAAEKLSDIVVVSSPMLSVAPNSVNSPEDCFEYQLVRERLSDVGVDHYIIGANYLNLRSNDSAPTTVLPCHTNTKLGLIVAAAGGLA